MNVCLVCGYWSNTKAICPKRGCSSEGAALSSFDLGNYREFEIGATLVGPFGIEFCWVPKGSFRMGSPPTEKNRKKNEGTDYWIEFAHGFWMSRFAITREQFVAVTGIKTRSDLETEVRFPAECWYGDADDFVHRLNNRNDGFLYALPTESEWEYAARAGSTTAFAFGDSIDSSQANFRNPDFRVKSNGEIKPNQIVEVGSYKPNAWGLYDMHGNVWEWVQDSYASSYRSNPGDGSPYIETEYDESRVMRGGDRWSNVDELRSASRDWFQWEEHDDRELAGIRLVARPIPEVSFDETAQSQVEESLKSTESFVYDERRVRLDQAERIKECEVTDNRQKLHILICDNCGFWSYDKSHCSWDEGPLSRFAPAAEVGVSVGTQITLAGFEFVWIPPGEFQMGSPSSEAERGGDEGPQRLVQIRHGFWLGKFQVTQEQYQKVVERNPSFFKQEGGTCPVDSVSWNDVKNFIQKLNRVDPGLVFSLPTEAEWEYAARAGTITPFSYGESLGSEQANFDGNNPYGNARRGQFLRRTTVVGSYDSNPWGLYDMHGNIWEWVEDAYSSSLLRLPSDGSSNAISGDTQRRVLRGGCWFNDANFLRSADRNANKADTRSNFNGFRLLARRKG